MRAVRQQLRFGTLGQGVGGIEVTTLTGQACFRKLCSSRPHRLSGVSGKPGAVIGSLRAVSVNRQIAELAAESAPYGVSATVYSVV